MVKKFNVGNNPVELTHIIGKDSWHRYGLMLLAMTHGKYMDSWYRHGLIV